MNRSLIGEEGREAYNSLIERKGIGLDIGISPAATLLRHMDTDEFELMNAKTLPRRLASQLSHPATAALEPLAVASLSAECPRPPRPMTLPTRGAAQRVRRAEQERKSDENRNSVGGASEACESPSYMTHPSYKFPEPHESAANPLPLPSREGKKQVKTSTKRHVRKYPLIIPANGVQRTLNKLADFGEDATGRNSGTSTQQQQQHRQPARSIEVVAAVRSNSVCRRSEAREYENMPAVTGGAAASSHTYQNLEKLTPADAAGLTDSASLQFESILEADMSKDGVLQSPDVTDGFYNFSIQKEHYNKSKDVAFEPAQISGLYVNDDELRNLDKPLASSSSSCTTLDSPAVPQEMAPTAATAAAAAVVTEAPQESPGSRRFGCTDNELAGNALFKKVRASVNLAMNRSSINGVNEVSNGATAATTVPTAATPPQKQQTEAEYFAASAARLADSNSVSCEDLLEFSDKKPRGCERGVDSDEVRIMVKVLGKDSTPTRCLGALEFINWDVHKSIKLIKLQNILSETELSLSAAFEALQQQEWDLHTTAVKLKGIKL
ncbi:hypothetical protein ACLKA6_006933 [Drosophila palustris]